jgi:WD40 repeat protein
MDRWRSLVLGCGLWMGVLAPMTGYADSTGANRHFVNSMNIPLPGRGTVVAWSPDGRQVAVGGHLVDHARRDMRYDTKIYDALTGEYVKAFGSHFWWIDALAWRDLDPRFVGPNPEGIIADGDGDHALKLWYADGAGTTQTIRGQYNVADGAVPAVRAIPGYADGLTPVAGWLVSLDFSPDGQYLAAASRDRTVRIWQIAPGPDQFHVVKIFYDATNDGGLCVRWSPDGRYLASGDHLGQVVVRSFDPVADRWDAATIASYQKSSWEGLNWWLSQHLADVTKPPVWTAAGHRSVWNVRYSPDGNRLAAVGTDGSFAVYDAATGSPIYQRQTAPLYGLDWSPDGQYLAMGSSNHDIYVYEAMSGTLYDTLEGSDDLVTTVARSPDGNTLASTAGGYLTDPGLNVTFVVQGPDMNVRFWTQR